MELDEESVREIVVAVGVVALFVATIVGIGVAIPQERFAQIGGLALVGAIALFILVMAGVGIYLSRQ